MNAEAIDCGSVIDPGVRYAELGESLAVNLAIVRRFSLSEENLYKVLLADYLRFCLMYIKESDVSSGLPTGENFVQRQSWIAELEMQFAPKRRIYTLRPAGR